jgi:hypothetical protein
MVSSCKKIKEKIFLWKHDFILFLGLGMAIWESIFEGLFSKKP